MKILILGGTQNARLLADQLSDQHQVIYSILGNTENARLPNHCKIIKGGFGGSDGLGDYLKTNSIELLIDATHPFATRMSKNAVLAANHLALPLMRLDRPKWQITERDNWQYFDEFSELETHLPNHINIFLALGNQAYQKFISEINITQHQNLIARMVMPPQKTETTHQIEIKRPPFAKEQEIATLKNHRIDAIIVKDSGGKNLSPLLLAARQLKIKCYLLKRPTFVITKNERLQKFERIEDLIEAVNLYKG